MGHTLLFSVIRPDLNIGSFYLRKLAAFSKVLICFLED